MRKQVAAVMRPETIVAIMMTVWVVVVVSAILGLWGWF